MVGYPYQADKNFGVIGTSYTRNETEKKKKYAEGVVQIEYGTFTPLVFSCLGGMSIECGRFYKLLSELLPVKRNNELIIFTNFVRTKISFSLLKSCLLCVRGSRSHKPKTHD